MKILSIVSAKGGVGKTTVTANLAAALAREGRQVLAVDLDPQNALRFHLGFDPHDVGGISRTTLARAPWSSSCITSERGVLLFPYGLVNEEDRRTFEVALDTDPLWLRRNLESLGLPEGVCVLLDTPPGPSVYLRQALRVADAALVVTLADAASYATLPMMEGLIRDYCSNRPGFGGAHYVVNQVDGSTQLSVDVTQVLRRNLGDRIIGLIHRDQAVSEALAYDRSVMEYQADSRAAHDFMELARSVDELLARLTLTNS